MNSSNGIFSGLNLRRGYVIAFFFVLVLSLLVLRGLLLSDMSSDELSSTNQKHHDSSSSLVRSENDDKNTHKQSSSSNSQNSKEENTNNNENDDVGAGGAGDHQENKNCKNEMYSTIRCIEQGRKRNNAQEKQQQEEKMFFGSYGDYGFPIYNRTCLYENIVIENSMFYLYLRTDEELKKFAGRAEDNDQMKVSLSSRPFDLPHTHQKRKTVRAKMMESHRWSPLARKGPIPCFYSDRKDEVKREMTLAYYSPIVAPWNVAHTLLCDLFGLFWAAYELLDGVVPSDLQVVGYGRHYGSMFELPPRKYNNVAFTMFSTRPPVYENGLKNGLYGRMLAGTGTKSWSWVTDKYSASGSPELWFAFRNHILRTVGIIGSGAKEEEEVVQDSEKNRRKKKIRVSICRKGDKRGVVNYDETMKFLREAAGGVFRQAAPEFDVEFVLETSVGMPVRKQVQLMLDADIYMCNEGTLSTPFFLMRPGSAFVSLPLVYHTPHLHQRVMPQPEQWWRVPDPLRPDPRKNTGGNIDWFPPSIPWVKTLWYDFVPMNETLIQLPLRGLRNYAPDNNIVIQRKRIVPLMKQAIEFVSRARSSSSSASSSSSTRFFSDLPAELLTDRPNYSVTADLCRQMLQANPSMTKSFNTARCLYGMSWLCEFWANTHYKWRFFHGKWSWRCGARESSVDFLKLKDPREDRPLSEFLFFNQDELAGMYNNTDFGKLKVRPDGSEWKFLEESAKKNNK